MSRRAQALRLLVLTPPSSVFTPEKFDWDSIWENRRSGEADDEEDIAAIEKNKGACGAGRRTRSLTDPLPGFEHSYLKRWFRVALISSVIIFV